MRLWDSLLSAEGPSEDSEVMEGKMMRFAYIDFIAVALVKNIRTQIIESRGDFAVCMEGLQQTSHSFKTIDQMDELMKKSAQICINWLKWLLARSQGHEDDFSVEEVG